MEDVDSEEPDTPPTTTASDHRTSQRGHRELLDGCTGYFKSSGGASNYQINYSDNPAPSRDNGILKEAFSDPSYLDSDSPQDMYLHLGQPEFSFPGNIFHGTSPTSSRSPREFAQASYQSMNHFIARETQPTRTDSIPSGYWENLESDGFFSALNPASLYNVRYEMTPDQNVAEQSTGAMTSHYHNPLTQPYVSGMQPLEDIEAFARNQQHHIEAQESTSSCQGWQESYRNGYAPQVGDPIGEEHRHQHASHPVHSSTVASYTPMEGTVGPGIHGDANQSQERHTQCRPQMGCSFVSPVLASLDRCFWHAKEGYIPHSGNGSSSVNTLVQDGTPMPRITIYWPSNVMPTDIREGDRSPNMDLETAPFRHPNDLWGEKRAALGSSQKPRQASTLSTRPGSSPPSPCPYRSPMADDPISQEVVPPDTGFTHDSTTREARTVRGLEKIEIPQALQMVFDAKTGEKPITKNRRRANSQQRRNTIRVRKIGACDVCRKGKRRCECKLGEQDKVAQVEKARRGRKRKQTTPLSASGSHPRPDRRFSMFSATVGSLVIPWTPMGRHQSDFSLATSITSNNSISAESAGSSETTQHIPSAMGDMATPPETQDDDNVVEDVTTYMAGIGAEGMGMSLSEVQERIQVPTGRFLVPQLPFRPATDERGQISTQPYLRSQEWNPDVFGSTPNIYELSPTYPIPTIPRSVSPLTNPSKPLAVNIGESTALVDMA